MIWMIFATLSLQASLRKVVKKWLGILSTRQQSVSIPLIDLNSRNVMKILQDMKKPAIKELIQNEDIELARQLSLLSHSNTPVGVALTKRRQINKCFMDCLQEVKLDHVQALLWLARKVRSDVADKMRSDWKYSGNWRENLKDQIIAAKEGLERYLSERINFVVKG